MRFRLASLMLKFSYANEADIPADIRKFYTAAADGSFVLQVEGVVPVAKLNEFRENNRAMKAELDTLKATFEGVDAGEYKKLKTRAELIEDGKAIAADKVEAKIAERLAAVKTEHDKAVAELTKKLTEATETVARHEIDGALRKAGAELGLLDTAVDDLILRGRSVFKLVDGKVVGYGPDGKELFSPKDGSPLAVKDWTENLSKTAPHLFKPSSGSGAGGSGSGSGGAGGGGTGKNPWKKETYNLTEQMAITRTNPTLAARLKAEAGGK